MRLAFLPPPGRCVSLDGSSSPGFFPGKCYDSDPWRTPFFPGTSPVAYQLPLTGRGHHISLFLRLHPSPSTIGFTPTLFSSNCGIFLNGSCGVSPPSTTVVSVYLFHGPPLPALGTYTGRPGRFWRGPLHGTKFNFPRSPLGDADVLPSRIPVFLAENPRPPFSPLLVPPFMRRVFGWGYLALFSSPVLGDLDSILRSRAYSHPQ